MMEKKLIRDFIKDINRPIFAGSVVLTFFLISLSGILFPSLEPWSSHMANRNYNGEGLIELIEAACWISASVIYLILGISEIKKNKFNLFAFWYCFFAVFCFVAFGEEISWGQNLFGFEASETVKIYNQQKEYNFHNLNIAEILGLSSQHPAYRYLKNFNSILNPLFYLTGTIIWFIIPLLRRAGKISHSKIINAMPMPNLGTVVFCGINIFAFLIIDKLIFESGEIFELSWGFVGIMVPLDVIWPKK